MPPAPPQPPVFERSTHPLSLFLTAALHSQFAFVSSLAFRGLLLALQLYLRPFNFVIYSSQLVYYLSPVLFSDARLHL